MSAALRWGSRIGHRLWGGQWSIQEMWSAGWRSLTFVLTVESPVTASAADGVGLGVAFTGHVE